MDKMKSRKKMPCLIAAALITALMMFMNTGLTEIAALAENAGGVELPDVTIGAEEAVSDDYKVLTFDDEDTYIGLFDGHIV